ncbi:MAG: hypothetical protein E5X53_37065, partial [Mesorhizobium sp.]
MPLDAVEPPQAVAETAGADAPEVKAPETDAPETDAPEPTDAAATATADPSPRDPAADLARLRELMAELAEAQGETPLILPS